MRKLLLAFLLLALLSVGVMAQDTQDASANSALRWWNDVTWYQIFVRSFYDSDGDGVGDFRGIIEKLDYLNDGDPTTSDDLGVTGIKLMPVHPAVSYHGYDVVDYYAVNPEFGTLADFRALLDAAHERGMYVIIDLVVNHVSVQSEQFQNAANGVEGFEDWFIFADEDPATPGPWGADAWHEYDDRFYYAVFCCGMPDFNYENPDVTAFMYDVARYWLQEVGVDGFRLDAIKYVVEVEEDNLLQNTPENRAWLADFNEYVKSIKPDALVAGEIDDTTLIIQRYVNDGSIDLGFEFDLAADMLAAARDGRNRDIARAFERNLQDYPRAQWIPFLSNHDQARTFTQLNGDIEANKAAASILLTTPGSPFIYYGEEIGLPGSKPDPRLRTPMHWTDEALTAGFSSAGPWEPLTDNLQTANVAAQTDDPDSLLSHYRNLVHLRNAQPALRQGAIRVMDRAPRPLLAFLRTHDEQNLLVLINLDDEAIEAPELRLRESNLTDITEAEVIFGAASANSPAFNQSGGFVDYVPVERIAAHGTVVIELR
jgi:alpha-amylase